MLSLIQNKNIRRNILGTSALLIIGASGFKIFNHKESKTELNNSTENGNLSKETLVSVQMLTRHGARTPMNLIEGLEEVNYDKNLTENLVKAKFNLFTINGMPMSGKPSYKDHVNMEKKLKGGAGRGQLTQIGEKQGFNLGRRIKNKYIHQMNFLSNHYDPKQIYVRSSHYNRTILTAKSFLAGVFNQSYNTESQSVPFIINVHELQGDFLVRNAYDCPHITEMNNYLKKLDLYRHNKYYNQKLQEMNRSFGNYLNSITFSVFWDDISARKCHGLQIPEFAEKIYDIIGDKYATMELSAASKHRLKISCGRLLQAIKENLINTIDNDSNKINTELHKFRYYSTHDSILNAVLMAFDFFSTEEERWPKFVADITIELWKIDEKNQNLENNQKKGENPYFFRIYYCDEPMVPRSFKKHTLKNYLKIDLNDFINLLEKNLIDEQGYKKACEERFI